MTEVLPPPKLASRFTERFDIILTADQLQPFLSSKANPPTPQVSTSMPRPVRMNSTPAMNTNAYSPLPADRQTIHTQPTPVVSSQTPPPLPSVSTVSGFATTIDMERNRKKLIGKQQEHINLLHPDYSATPGSFHRADHVIKRLENWNIVLKLASYWNEEIARILSNPHYKRVKKEQNELYDRLHKRQKQTQASVHQFRKECHDQIRSLKGDPALGTEELLQRANQTKKYLRHLAQLCDYAEDPTNPKLPEKDPWQANLLVLRYLKRELTEENRLRTLMAAIQKEIHDLETHICEALALLVELGAELQTSVTHYGTTLDTVLAAILPFAPWNQYIETVKHEWVDEDHIEKNYLKINYPKKQHPLVATAQRGVLGRRAGVLKQYHKKYYILTHYGFLHQYKMNDRYKPEGSILVAGGQMEKPAKDDDKDDPDQETDRGKKKAYLFDVRFPKKRGKTLHFRTKNKRDWELWCRRMTEVTNQSSVQVLLEKRERVAALKMEKQQLLMEGAGSSSSQPAVNGHHHYDDDDSGDSDLVDPHEDHDNDDDDDDDDDEVDDHIQYDQQSHLHSIDASMRSSNEHMAVDDESSLRIVTAESDIMSLDVTPSHPSVLPPSRPSNLLTANTDATLPPQPPASVSPLSAYDEVYGNESGIYFSSTSSVDDSSTSPSGSPPSLPSLSQRVPRHGPSYQPGLNLSSLE
ncbi:hypothetical protein DM01DRAFT_1411214 [Hesseltinella vesiculosa]|uniref:PH domain-containing protein n=1 Tax=Hesseltinella vesiculosa TaxID=101127 RepID=A0A1X2G4G6_9FUNG|nr:hypothetical protein DM01DRAFT_1411214 [Hesseltinella vesiculosa]